MSEKQEKIKVQIRYKDVSQDFSAEPQEAWLMVNQFFREFIPTFEIAQKLWLTIDLQQLARDLNGIAAYSTDGASLLTPKNKLTDYEALSIWLTAQYLGCKLGMISSDAMSKEELQTKIEKSGKIVSTRLGELAKNGMVAKTADDKFRITTYGLVQTQKEVIPKIRTKLKA